jgi:C1A family cysteine protease
MLIDATKIKLTTRPSKFDNRDILYKVSPRTKVDLREWDSPIESQYELGSCVGNAIANAYEIQVKRLYPEKFTELSRLFIYYNARRLEGTSLFDSGAYIRSGLQAVKIYGVCSESIWAYDISKFDDRPSEEAYTDAKTRTISKYTRLMNSEDIVRSLDNNMPVVIGVDVFDSFLSLTKEDSVVKVPTTNDKLSGGHAMCVVGYNLENNMFLLKNSFGTDWGDGGYCWMPFDYLDYYAWDLWNFDISLN